MLTYEDCVGLSTLMDEEASAIAEHEHIPRVIAGPDRVGCHTWLPAPFQSRTLDLMLPS